MMQPPLVPLLIVEDNPMYAEILQRLLPTLDAGVKFDAQWVDTAEKAKAKLEQNIYDVVLLDYKLPGADGLEVLHQIRGLAADKQPAVIMLTGMGNEAIAVQAMKIGAKDYLAKDHLDVASLTRAIVGSLERKRLECQVAAATRALREKNEQMHADLLLAREIQQALMPQEQPNFPAHSTADSSRLQFVTRYQPTGAVGGDFFDVLELSPTAAGVFICDVMGHGVRAALVTGIVRALVEESRPLAEEPGQFLTKISARLLAILKQTRTPMFASAFYMVMDTADGTLRFASAGHPAPLHVRRSAGKVDDLCASDDCGPGPALGVFEDSIYLTARKTMVQNDFIMLFTDGVFEVVGANDEQFGHERLLSAVRRRIDMPRPELCDAVLSEIRAFSAEDGFVDDVCLVGMEVKRVG